MGIAAPEPVAVPGGAAPAPPAGGAKRGPRPKQWTITIIAYTDKTKRRKKDGELWDHEKGKPEHDDAHDFVPDDELPPEAEAKYNTNI